jgi:hypothetical protein
MTTKLFFENKATHKRYEVLKIDKTVTPPMLTLQGEVAKFEQEYDRELFRKLGYEPVQVKSEDDQ